MHSTEITLCKAQVTVPRTVCGSFSGSPLLNSAALDKVGQLLTRYTLLGIFKLSVQEHNLNLFSIRGKTLAHMTGSCKGYFVFEITEYEGSLPASSLSASLCY